VVGFVREVVRHRARAAVDGVRQVFGRPRAVHHVHKKRGLAEHVEVVVGSRRADEEVVDVKVMVADSLEYNGAPLLPGHVLTGQGLGAPPPLLVGAVQGADATW